MFQFNLTHFLGMYYLEIDISVHQNLSKNYYVTLIYYYYTCSIFLSLSPQKYNAKINTHVFTNMLLNCNNIAFAKILYK